MAYDCTFKTREKPTEEFIFRFSGTLRGQILCRTWLCLMRKVGSLRAESYVFGVEKFGSSLLILSLCWYIFFQLYIYIIVYS